MSIKTGGNFPKRLFFRYFGPVSFLAFLVLSSWISGISEGVSAFFALGVYALLFYFLRISYARILGRDYPKFRAFLLSYVRIVGSILWIVFWGLAAFSVYQNEIAPAELSAYVLSNGEKTVMFRTMSHIASERFYDDVGKEFEKARKDGYVLFYEGVRPGTAENSRRFEGLLWVKFDKELYESMSELYGLVPQDTESIASGFAPSDRNVDVGIDDIVAFFDRRKGNGPASQAETPVLAQSGQTSSGKNAEPESSSPNEPEDLAANFSEYAKSLSPRELSVLRYVNRAVMASVIKGRETSSSALFGFWNAELFAAILHDRNEVIAQAILNSEEKKIYAMYGLLHFDGVFDLLQESDSRWKVSAPPKKLFPLVP